MKTFCLISCLLLNLFAYAQPQIVVQNATSESVYTDLQTAINSAVSGDYVYLPGAYYDLGTTPLTIDKEVHMIGAGFHPDSTSATGFTRINGDIHIMTGADNSTIEAFELTGGDLRIFEASTNVIDNLLFRHLRINDDLVLNHGTTTGSKATNIVVDKCILKDVEVNSAQYVTIENNIILGTIFNSYGNCTIDQNVFFTASFPFNIVNNSIISNNILESVNLNGCSYNSFYNNLTDASSISLGATNSGSGNIFSIPLNTVFATYPNNTYNYLHDLHLSVSSPAVGAGLGGSDLGIYGGSDPYKEGSVPHNPHIQLKVISGTTNPQGILNVELKGRAQEF